MIPKAEADKVPMSPAAAPETWNPTRMCVAVAKRYFCSAGYDILNVDISKNGEVVARYFADPVTDEFKAYLIGEPWRRIKLENIIQLACGLEPRVTTDRYVMRWDLDVADWTWDEGSDVLAQAVLGREVSYFENSSEHERYMDREDRRIGRITDRLNRIIAQAPEGFEAWAAKLTQHPSAVCTNRWEKLELFTYQCTECRGVWPRKTKYRQNRRITCPICGAELTAENSPRTGFKNIYLFSAAADGSARWYERFIWSYSYWDVKNASWSLKLTDAILGVIESGKQFGKLYYRSGLGYDDRCGGSIRHMTSGVIYPDFCGAEKYMTGQQKHCLRVLADVQMEVNANYMIIMPYNPSMEYLLKGRFWKLAKEIINSGVFMASKEAGSIPEALRIDKQRCNRLRQINGGHKELEWLRYEQKTGYKVSADDLSYFVKHAISPDETYRGTRAMLSRIPSPAVFRHYLEKQSRMSNNTPLQTVDLYTDYIRMAEEQGLNLASEIFYKPRDLAAAHDECVRVAHSNEYKKAAQKVITKFPMVPGVLESIRDKYTYSNGQYAIVVPAGVEDIIAEGRALGHCIDTTDRYFDRIQQHVTYLVFLRRANSCRTSWYTLEIEPGGTVRQQRTTGNRQNKEDTDAYMPFIREWQRVVRERISEEDKALAAKSREIRIAEYRELREKKETVRNGLLQGRLLVDVLEADLVEA